MQLVQGMDLRAPNPLVKIRLVRAAPTEYSQTLRQVIEDCDQVEPKRGSDPADGYRGKRLSQGTRYRGL